MSDKALKFDSEKIQLDLLPVDALLEVGKVMTFGCKKYAAHNWRKGFDHSRLYAAALRHIYSSLKGEEVDPESGLDHVSHAACCVLFLLEHRIHSLGKDDRYVYPPKS